MSIGDYVEITSKNQNFLLATSCNESSVYQSLVLGLGYYSTNASDLFIPNLKAANAITQSLFSIFLNDVGFNGKSDPVSQSVLILGDYDVQLYASDPNDEIILHSVIPQTTQWKISLDVVEFDTISFIEPSNAIIDPGMRYIYGPKIMVGKILNALRLNNQCGNEDGLVYCLCSSVYDNPTLSFTIDGHKYSIESQFYQRLTNGQCFTYIIPIKENYWIFGQIFLRKYYSIWNYESGQIGFIESINIPAPTDNTSSTWVIVLVVVLVVGILGGALLILCIIYKKKKDYRESISMLRISK